MISHQVKTRVIVTRDDLSLAMKCTVVFSISPLRQVEVLMLLSSPLLPSSSFSVPIINNVLVDAYDRSKKKKAIDS